MPEIDEISAAQSAVSKYLKAVRKLHGWSMTETGRRIGVSKTTIARNEKPPKDYRYVMSTTSLRKLARESGMAPPPELLAMMTNGVELGFREADVALYEGPPPPGRKKQDNPNRSDWTVGSRALELAGYMPGDIVTIDQGVRERHGDIVIAQIYDEDGGGAETVLRRYQTGARQPYLTVATTDTDMMMQEPDYVDNARVKIMGTVIQCVRQRSP